MRQREPSLFPASRSIDSGWPELARTFDPLEFIKGRKGHGGPQPESLKRLLDDQRKGIEEFKS